MSRRFQAPTHGYLSRSGPFAPARADPRGRRALVKGEFFGHRNYEQRPPSHGLLREPAVPPALESPEEVGERVLRDALDFEKTCPGYVIRVVGLVAYDRWIAMSLAKDPDHSAVALPD